MIVTTSSSEVGSETSDSGGREAVNTLLMEKCGGASVHSCTIESASVASPQQISDGEQSLIIATNSLAACRAYSGTTVNPSAIIAKSIATHCTELCAKSAHRSPFLNRNRRR